MNPEFTIYIFSLTRDTPDWDAAAQRIQDITVDEVEIAEEHFGDTDTGEQLVASADVAPLMDSVRAQLDEDLSAVREALEVAEQGNGRMIICRKIGDRDYFLVGANKISDEPEHYYEGVVARLGNLEVLEAAGYEFF